MDTSGGRESERRTLLAEAKAAAVAGDVKVMFTKLHLAGVMEALMKQLRENWPRLHGTDADYIVGEAVNAWFEAVHAGKGVSNVVAYIWKTADHMAQDHVARRKREQAGDLEDALGVADPRLGALRGDVRPVDADEVEGRRREALAHARRLPPRLGQANVQAVMAYVFDAVERHVIDLSNAEIAEALGLSKETVRTSLSRGFRRLARKARKEGLVGHDFEPAALGVEGQDAADDDAGEDANDHQGD